ncbi:Hypothetical predicted protein [Pelobates cultripes]|uniref:Uncharacterized protein n=1 Tax=Pelobates cultripes TaxID=61616 RepID=A0AAD1SY87_PELCU|nr:Hypothetical predicted protein [Pelobates cultripes]
MAAATGACHAELPDCRAKLDDIFNKFWKTIADREQQNAAHKQAKQLPKAQLTCSQGRHTVTPASRAQKWRQKRRGPKRARKHQNQKRNVSHGTLVNLTSPICLVKHA